MSDHARRPLVCRIYPAEVNRFIALAPANKACPAEAWAKHLPVLQRADRIVDQHVIDDIRRSREAGAADVGVKQRLCSRLQISDAGIANEGLCAHTVDQATLLNELAPGAAQIPAGSPPLDWRLVSNRAKTVTALLSVGARSGLAQDVDRPAFEYLGSRASKD